MKSRLFTLIWLTCLPILGFASANIETDKKSDPATPATTEAKAPAQPAAPISPATIDCQYKVAKDTDSVEQTLLSTWAEHAAVQSFQFNPKNLNAELDALKKCYTEQGWKAFNEALKTSGNLDAIRGNQLTVTSQVSGTATVKSVKDQQWKVSIPLKVTYQNADKQLLQALNVDLLIALNKKSGALGIMQVIAVPRDATDKKI
ncbi:MAG: DotI/IcmL family type IV secretion protein [Legionellaceae bacterium]|nr:DotI/IcmL family type IV secretion protein [Legionellaceae bacterium]